MMMLLPRFVLFAGISLASVGVSAGVVSLSEPVFLYVQTGGNDDGFAQQLVTFDPFDTANGTRVLTQMNWSVSVTGSLDAGVVASPTSAVWFQINNAYLRSAAYKPATDSDTVANELIADTSMTIPNIVMNCGQGESCEDTWPLSSAMSGEVLEAFLTFSAAGPAFFFDSAYLLTLSGIADFSLVELLASGMVTVEYVYRDVSQQVPEPATLALVGLGLAGIGAVRRKKLAA